MEEKACKCSEPPEDEAFFSLSPLERGVGGPSSPLTGWVLSGGMPSLLEEQLPLCKVGVTAVLTSFIHPLIHLPVSTRNRDLLGTGLHSESMARETKLCSKSTEKTNQADLEKEGDFARA